MIAFHSSDVQLKCLFDAWWYAFVNRNQPALVRLDALITNRLNQLGG